MKIIAGVYTDYQGVMRLDGAPVRFHSARDAMVWLRLGTCFFHFRCSFAFHSAFHRVFLQANPALPSSSFRALRAIMCYIHYLYGSL